MVLKLTGFPGVVADRIFIFHGGYSWSVQAVYAQNNCTSVAHTAKKALMQMQKKSLRAYCPIYYGV